MRWEEGTVYIVILSLFAAAGVLLVLETRSLWAAKVLVYEGNLTAYSKSSDFHVFSFEDGTSKTLRGWMWKRYPGLHQTYALYTKGRAIVLEEKREPVIT